MSGRDDERGLDEEDALAVLADETRVRILKALGDATTERPGLPRLSYTALRERAGIRDSGRFNYHLSRLEGTWIEKHDDGYKLPKRGQKLYDALVAGSFTGEAAPEPIEFEDRCPYCDSRLTARYTEHDVRFLVVCEECGAGAANVYFPPNSLDTYTDPDTLVDAATAHARMEICQLVRGQCYDCGGPVHGELHTHDPDEGLPWGLDERPLSVYATFTCEECTAFHYTTVGQVAACHPRVIGFCDAHGTDITSARPWEHDWLLTDRHTTVDLADPLRVSVEVTPDGDTEESLMVTLGPHASVLDIEAPSP
jgi:hypothetical protein